MSDLSQGNPVHACPMGTSAQDEFNTSQNPRLDIIKFETVENSPVMKTYFRMIL